MQTVRRRDNRFSCTKIVRSRVSSAACVGTTSTHLRHFYVCGIWRVTRTAWAMTSCGGAFLVAVEEKTEAGRRVSTWPKNHRSCMRGAMYHILNRYNNHTDIFTSERAQAVVTTTPGNETVANRRIINGEYLHREPTRSGMPRMQTCYNIIETTDREKKGLPIGLSLCAVSLFQH